MLIHTPHRQRDCQTPPSPFPSNLLAKEGELKLRDKWLQHYATILLMPESSGSCSTPLFPGWGQWAQTVMAFSGFLATVCKYEQCDSPLLTDWGWESLEVTALFLSQPQAEMTFPCPLTRTGGCRQPHILPLPALSWFTDKDKALSSSMSGAHRHKSYSFCLSEARR